MARVRIAVVIPALDEAEEISAAVESARAQGVEIIVVDGGSRDDTQDRARAAGARLLVSSQGRARQLQTGIRESEGEVVLILHADTRLPKGWDGALREALADPTVAGGAFRLRFDERGATMRVIEWGAHLRSAWLGLPYGDQAIFVRRRVVDEMGGLPDVPVMEDVDLVRAIKQDGRLALLSLPATTSARRHLEGGALRTALFHSLALLADIVGVERSRIAGWLSR